MEKPTKLSMSLSLQLICLIKGYYDCKDWVIVDDLCLVVVYDDSDFSRNNFLGVVKRRTDADLQWYGNCLSITWKGGEK